MARRASLWLYVESFWEPFGTLWFIYLLPIFFVVTKLRATLRIPVALIWIAAAALEIAHIETGWTVIDEFASRFVYFYTGYLLAPRIFALASEVQARPETALAGLTVWGLINGLLVFDGYRDAAVRLAGAWTRSARSQWLSVSALMAQERRVPAAALLRPQLDRHLSGVLPADGGEPRRCCSRPAGSPISARSRRWSRSCGVIGVAAAVLGGARHRRCGSCSSGRSGSGCSEGRLALQPAE